MNNIASIIILTYKRFDTVYNVIRSSLEQDYPAIEIVVADDGSEYFPKDEIVDFIKTHSKENLVNHLVYSNENNLGTVRNINCAINRSQGRYILPMASDDVFFSLNTVSLIVQKLEESETGMVSFRRLLTDENDHGIRFMPSVYHEKAIRKLKTPESQHRALARGEFYEMASGSSTFYTRDQLQEEGLFDEQYRLLEDWTQFLELTKKRLLEFDYDITAIRYKKGGISSSNSPVMVNDYIKMMDNEIEYGRKNNYTKQELAYLLFRKEAFCNNKIIVYLKYPIPFISRCLYKLRILLFEKMAEFQYRRITKRRNEDYASG